jgi:HK97 family phage prohead protease
MTDRKPLQLQHNAVIKAVNESSEGILIIKGIASMYRTPEGFLQIDRDNELMNLDFMDLDSYKKNPILCFQHDWSIPAGRVIEIEHKNGALHITAEVHRLTGKEHIYEAVQKGIIKSLSIGTIPHDFVYRETHDGDVLEIARSTLVEISLTTVQSNQEALFTVVAEKSPTISKQVLAAQNGMSCDEMTGSCAFKSELKDITGKSINPEKVQKMDTITKQPEPTAEGTTKVDVAPDVKPEPVADVTPSVTPEPKQETVISVDSQALAAAYLEAQIKAEELKTAKEEAAQQAAAELKASEEAAEKARIEGAIKYIKDTKDKLLSIPDEQFDIDQAEEFYSLVSEAAEAIEGKVMSIIKPATVTA